MNLSEVLTGKNPMAPAPAKPLRRPASTSWVEVEPGSYVARRSGALLGAVVLTGTGSFVAVDRDSNGIGRYGTLTVAQRAVISSAAR
ncbi:MULTISPECIES: hypothetical protein [unclassified Microbacterium]|uniref:hypothetical protein n=1 Tax=unclassified Microbacterium TaxID=2609290 RepID=UPI00214C3C58|nr:MULTISPECIES: hypothetical protein [unclassified Microbacterium]MCR2810706.1 hypothetical protein [Microbacterium sp. zg.B185]WIM18242.1 hypothetical protein QNO12_11570 [Microbacterium sp. zg-B185]